MAASVMTAAVLSSRYIYVKYLRRIPNATAIRPSFWRRRSLFGRVTSVGDGDGLRLFHTPGGRLAGWGWFPGRRIPHTPKELKDQTISIRLAGVDAPEMAHFGKTAQPGSTEAFEYLTALVAKRRVRVYLHKKDQYERAVATVYVRRPPFLWRTDVSLQLLRLGLATVYEGKTGAEFGGDAMEEKYRKMEQRARLWRRGIWGSLGKEGDKPRESPMEFKKRSARESGQKPPLG